MAAHRLRPNARDDAKRSGLNLADEVRFFKTWASHPLSMGAVSPSGRALARMMVAEIDPAWPGMVVELGPGTGSVTTALLEHGVAPERLVAIEFDSDFASHLGRRFPGVRIVEGDAYALKRTLALHDVGPIAAVVSGLPLLTRPLQDRRDLLSQAMELLPPGRPFVQMSYALTPPVAAERDRWTLDVSPWIWMNLPPARVWTYRAPCLP